MARRRRASRGGDSGAANGRERLSFLSALRLASTAAASEPLTSRLPPSRTLSCFQFHAQIADPGRRNGPPTVQVCRPQPKESGAGAVTAVTARAAAGPPARVAVSRGAAAAGQPFIITGRLRDKAALSATCGGCCPTDTLFGADASIRKRRSCRARRPASFVTVCRSYRRPPAALLGSSSSQSRLPSKPIPGNITSYCHVI